MTTPMTTRSSRHSKPLSHWGGSRFRLYFSLQLAISTVVFVTLLLYNLLPAEFDIFRDVRIEDEADAEPVHRAPAMPVTIDTAHQQTVFESTSSGYAYATFLSGDSATQDEDAVIDDDKYYIATRILAYQLLHAPETRTTNDIPFIVLVTSDVAEAKRERLRRDGAIVWEAEPVHVQWNKTNEPVWQDMMTKLRLWELIQFERIAFLDADTVLTAPLDGIFEDPAVVPQTTKDRKGATLVDEASLPQEYVFAGTPEMSITHQWPPSRDGMDYPNINYLNGGFFVMQPSNAMVKYYTSLLAKANRFDPHKPDQNLFNYAHRRDGNMPWRQLDVKWNIHYPTPEDLKGGVASLHEKWWAPVYHDLGPFLESRRWKMEGFYEARDALLRRCSRLECRFWNSRVAGRA